MTSLLVLIALAALAVTIVHERRGSARARDRLDEVARLLGLRAADPQNPRALSGTVDELSLVLAADEDGTPPRIMLMISGLAPISITPADHRRRERSSHTYPTVQSVMIAAEQSVPAELRDAERDAVDTHDSELDAIAEVSGATDLVVAILDEEARERITTAIERHQLHVQDRSLHAAITVEPSTSAEDIAASARSLAALAKKLRRLNLAERRASLAKSAMNDRDARVRARNLEVLLLCYPESEEARSTLAAALAGSDSEVLLVAALHAGAEGIPILSRLVTADDVSEEVLASSLFELAASAPVPHVEVFARALASSSEIVQLAAIGGLNMVDLGLLPLGEILDRLPQLEPNAQHACLRMLARVSEEGAALDAELKAKIARELVARGALEGGEPGALAVVREDEGARGALSFDRTEGAVSIADPSDP